MSLLKLEDPYLAQFALANREIAGIMGAALLKAYPGRCWLVAPDAGNGIVNIFLADVTTAKGYTVHLGNKCLFDLERDAVFAGGEILERFNLTRGIAFNADAVSDLRRDLRGQAIEL